MRMRPGVPIFVFGLTILAGAASGQDQSGDEFFEKRVRPILVERCHECHSSRVDEPKGNLRLDSRTATLKGGDTGPAMVPGKPKESLLIDAINHGDLYQMPPKSKLPAEEIAVLTKWVEMGAPWPERASGQLPVASGHEAGGGFDLAKRKREHWCWQPITKPRVPSLRNPQSAIRNPIDAFIAAKLEERGLSPAPPADKRTLIRRAYFDLIGLPPTVEEMEAFVAISPSLHLSVSPSENQEGETERKRDREREAFANVVDKLLASPRFGERWGRHWLDLVRYAESRGHEFDYNIPNAFEYRDYVIRALNADLPYDQFFIEHVAGDLLDQPRLHPAEGFNESIIGTGFWFLGEWCHSPVDIRKDECDRMDNMIDVFSKTFLGVTVACARCHDHKFDAISQEDYYALAGYLKSSSYRLVRFQTWQQDRQIAAELAALEAKYRPRIAAAVAKSLRPKVEPLAKRLAAEIEKLATELGVATSDLNGAKVIIDYGQPSQGAWMTEGPTFGTGPVRAGQIVLTGEAAVPLEVATYGSARRDAAWGDLAAADTSENDSGRLGGWLRAGRALKTPTFTIESGFVHYLIEGVGQVYAAVDSHAMINGPLHGELLKDTGGNSDVPMRWITHDLSRYVGHRVHLEFSPKEGEDFRLLMVVEGRERPVAPANRPNVLLSGVVKGTKNGSQEQLVNGCRKIIFETVEAIAGDRLLADAEARDRAALANWLVAKGELDESREVGELCTAHKSEQEALTERILAESRLCLAMWDGTPADEYLLIRGNHRTVGPVVPRRGLEAVQGSGVRSQESVGSGRLELARQLVDRDNPLVSRVIVNRVWQHLMGRGIVPSVDNFGVLGQEPTHPELLDYLAAEFMEDGWSIKRLIRRIMLSSTYQQGSGFGVQNSDGREAAAADPQNLLFHRQNVKRLEGEAIRDAILAISGRLDATMHRPSVPVYLTPFMEGRGRPKESGPLDGAGRRSIYIAVRRNFLPPMMLAFDTPIPFTTIGRRNVSNVPAQALTLMNDPFVAEQALLWARRTLEDGQASPQVRVRHMYLAAFSREPTDAETAAAVAFLEDQAHEYGLVEHNSTQDERVWRDLAHVVFNVKEFVVVE
jgi:hypothetical protein